MKKTVCMIWLALCVVSLAACAKTQPVLPQESAIEIPAAETWKRTPERTPAPTPAPTPLPPAQRAATLLPDGVLPANAESFAVLRAELDQKLAETEKTAAALGLLEEHYYRAVMEETIPTRLELMIDSENVELARRAEIALFQWSELADFSLRMEGYVGILRALCEGDDLFNMKDDAEDLTGDGAWPKGYFFDDFLTPLDSVDSFLVCDAYLDGYGMDEALLCSFGRDGLALEKAQAYIDGLKTRGLYTYSENRSDTQTAWYGCWVGGDGQNCYLYVERSPVGGGSIMQQLCDNREFIVMAGNFDFMLCMEVAMREYYL